MSPETPAAEPISRVRDLLAEVGEVVDSDADSVVVRVGRTRASVRAIDLAEELRVLTITQLIALNLPNTPELRDDVENHDARLSFGSLRRSDPEGVTTDVLLYYTFPFGGLADIGLLTVLHLVLTTGAEVAGELVGG
ncbi:hypothetical protein GYA93_02175 [Gordonia desulfuricans]|uniref:Uncharacterized protein n=1 Tax=Gordonia desulfuricans TaxID=89051 RepID=A0A7K3LJF7_9ACTN|nr:MULTISPECIES: hypothetical protein [Gordonia]EMP11703.1 hypothetical protein ISGA_3515 [Gordonia sp. NB41Y]NDK88395.1 hypothetical protein [Gordonia desulfuricans]WLP90205.1 hypothetical protein Q9K23_22250 [Gordonia sp. NB41Y]